jgi:putative ATP-binding cassette transporter
MAQQEQSPLKVTAARFLRSVLDLAGSEVGTKAKFMFAGLIALLCGLSALNVVNNYVGRNFMTAIAERQTSEFIRQAIYYVCVFAALTVVSVIARFAEERLALLWREFLTRRAVNVYLEDGAYHHLDASGQLSHPDQRIAEDVHAFTVTTLSFVIMLFSSTLTVVTFSSVLWSISPLLFAVAVLYAALGSYMTIVLGRPLIDLNFDRLDKEASFRSSLIHVRENAESVMLTRGEERQKARLLRRIDDVVANIRRITAVNRNLGFFTGGYNWMIQLVPDLIIAPAFIRGEIEFGIITQAGAAFAMLVGAFSLIVRQFNSISNFAAVVSRLSSLQEAIEKSHITLTTIEVAKQDGPLTYEGLTLASSASEPPLLKELSVSIPFGTRVLVTGATHAPGAALFRATAGIPTQGAGRIIRPDDVMFLPQRPYLPSGTLREMLVHPEVEGDTSDDRIARVLDELDLEQVINRAGGLDGEQNWEKVLSLGEQQLLALANVLLAAPRFVLLDRVEMTLSSEQLNKILQLLSERSITCINIGKAGNDRDLYQAVLEYGEDGRWTWTANPTINRDH